MKRWQYGVKRLIDAVGAAVAMIVLSPLLAVVGLMIRVSMGSPVLYRQVRAGRAGKPFTVYKFKTMSDARDARRKLLPDAERLTRLGRFLRKASLDELPQLWNVLKGEMSLVGPRPLLVEYLPRYTPDQSRRHDVRPGITGLAQVMGRNAIPFSERLAYDVWYVDNFDLRLDLKILVMTLLRVSTGSLYDGAGQDVKVVDDIGLHPGEGALGDGSLDADTGADQ